MIGWPVTKSTESFRPSPAAFRFVSWLAAAAVLVACARLERRGTEGLTTVEATFEADLGAIRAAVQRLCRGPVAGGRFRRFSVAVPGDEYFPAEFQLSHYRKDSSLERYLAIPPERRKNDLYLYDFSDADDLRSYWHTEYFRSGRPVWFRCDFLIHLEPAGPGSYRVEIFEYVPRVWLGKKFALGPHGPGFYLNVKEVEPTTRDRLELRDAIQSALGESGGASRRSGPST